MSRREEYDQIQVLGNEMVSHKYGGDTNEQNKADSYDIDSDNNDANYNQQSKQSPLTKENENDNTQQNNLIYRQLKPTHKVQHKKDSLHTQLHQLQSRLFHQIVLKNQLSTQKEQDRQTIKKLSQPILQEIAQLLQDINLLETKITNGLLLNNMEKRQIKQKILEKRMEQLASVRVLSNVYRHHEYRLLISTLNIVLLYQDLGCHQQAITHLQSIKEINSRFRNKTQDAEYMHSMILTLLALSLYQLAMYKESIDNLNAAIEIQQSLKEQSCQVKDFFTLNLTAKVLTASKQFKQAMSFANMTLLSAQKLFTDQSIQYTWALKSLAEAQTGALQFQSALTHINKAIQILQRKLPQRQQTIIQFYSKLTDITLKKLNSTHLIQQNYDHFSSYIEVLRKKYQTIEKTYGYRDKRAIKDKRHLASSLLKYQRIDQAEEELQDILEIEQTVYGQKSVQVAKTLKLLGSVAMSKNQASKAQKFLRKSMGIFHDQGQVGSQKQVQAKLLILTGKGKFVNSKY